MNLIQTLEKEQMAKLSAGKEIPDFAPGDTVLVNVKVVEGERTRVQAYEGVCIGRSGARPEREFHGAEDFLRRRRGARFPALFADDRIPSSVVRRGTVRRAKLYYLRGRRGKAARITERQDHARAEPRPSDAAE